MKLIREKLYEKYTEKSDPIDDMEIGAKATLKLQKVKKYCEDVNKEIDEFFDEMEELEIDPDDMDSDEFESYIANDAIRTVSNNILYIINEQL